MHPSLLEVEPSTSLLLLILSHCKCSASVATMGHIWVLKREIHHAKASRIACLCVHGLVLMQNLETLLQYMVMVPQDYCTRCFLQIACIGSISWTYLHVNFKFSQFFGFKSNVASAACLIRFAFPSRIIFAAVHLRGSSCSYIINRMYTRLSPRSHHYLEFESRPTSIFIAPSPLRA